VAAYGFEEAAGTTATDDTGNNHKGAISGATRVATGRFGRGLSFDGINDWVRIAATPLLSLTAEMTVEAWVYPTVNGSGLWRTVVFKEPATGVQVPFGMYANSDTNRPTIEVIAASQPGAPRRAGGTSQLPLNTWTHIAASHDGVTTRMFVNGVQVGSAAVSGPLTSSAGAVLIGGNSVWGEHFAGRIDEVRIYDIARTAAEITEDMTTAIVPTDSF
jgi:hypothetical protein